MSESQLPLVEKKQTYKSVFTIALIAWNIALSFFYNGYCTICLGTIPIETLKQVYNISIDDGTARGLLNGCIPIGGLVGALGSSILIARMSRRNCLLFMNAFAFVLGALVYIQNFPILVIVRICQGLCVGFFSAFAPLIIKELCPNQISGSIGSFAQLNNGVFIGSLFTYLLKKITGDESCKEFQYLVLGLTQLTLLVQSLVLLFVFPYETPKYLLLQGKEQQAKKLIEILYKPEHVDEVLEEKKGDIRSLEDRRNVEVESILSQPEANNHKRNYITIVVAIHLAILQQLSGINAVAIYGGTIVSKATSGELALVMPSLIILEQVLATFFNSFLLTKFGRKIILMIGALGEGIACGIIMIGFFIQDDLPQVSEVLVLVGLFLFMAVFGLSIGPTIWLYIPEIVQPKIVPYSTASNWIFAAVVIFLFPILTDNVLGGNPALLFAFFTVWCMGSFVFNSFFVIETKDKSEKTIKQEYASIKLC